MAQRDAAILEYRANPHGELLATPTTPPQKPRAALAVLPTHLIHVRVTTARTGGSVAPPLVLHEFDRRQLVRTRRWQRSHDARFVLCDLAHIASKLDLNVAIMGRCVKYQNS